MNLDSNDIELIKQTVEAAIARADVVKESTFKEFKQEVLADRALFVQREVFQLELKRRDDEIARLAEEVEESRNVLKNLWASAGGRVVAVAAGVLVLADLWQLFQK